VTSEDQDAKRLRKRYPTAAARFAADKAVDDLPETAPMTTHIDAWIAAYRKAGGKDGR
jgi:hypothetical protein